MSHLMLLATQELVRLPHPLMKHLRRQLLHLGEIQCLMRPLCMGVLANS